VKAAGKLHSKLRTNTFKRSDEDLFKYKQKLDYSLVKIRDCENNIEELKYLQCDEGKKYQTTLKSNLLLSLTFRIRHSINQLSMIKSLNEEGFGSSSQTSSKFGYLEDVANSLNPRTFPKIREL